MSETDRIRAARALLEAVPFVMRTVGISVRSAGVDMAPHQHRLLGVLSHRSRSLRELATIQGVTPATATALVTTLESHGWVARTRDEADRRRVVVAITDAGRAAHAQAHRAAEHALAAAFVDLDERQLANLIEALETLKGVSAVTTCPHHSKGSCA